MSSPMLDIYRNESVPVRRARLPLEDIVLPPAMHLLSTYRGVLRLLLIWGIVALAVPSRPPALAQSDGETPAFFDVVDVEIVNIDVFVTDKQGNPVTGLGKDDFLVYRDGEPIDIANFYAVTDNRLGNSTPKVVAEPASPQPEPPAPRMAAGGPREAQVPPEHRLWLIVYIDNYNIDPIERKRVFPALHRFLAESLGPGAQAMIVTFDRTLEVRQPFTDHLPSLFDTLDEIKDESGHAVVRRRELMETFHLIDDAESSDQALLDARRFAEEVMNEVGHTVDALERMVDSLAGLPGRKALVHVSSGVPMLAGEPAFHAVASRFETSEPYSEIPRHDTSRSFERLIRHANAHRVIFYTLDAGGLRGMEFGKAEYGGFVNMSLRNTLDSVVPENLQAPLRLMAFETGGQAILNRNEVLPALREAARDFHSFYSLGISSADADSARYHKIEVKLRPEHKGQKWLVRYRAGYRSKTLVTRVQDNLRSALLYAYQSNPLNLEVRWGKPEREGSQNTWVLPIQLRLPLQDLVLLPVDNGKHELRLRLFIAAVGEGGDSSEIQDVPLGLRVADDRVEAARRESFIHVHKIRLNRGRRKVGIAVLDVFGQQSSIVTGFVEVGAAG